MAKEAIADDALVCYDFHLRGPQGGVWSDADGGVAVVEPVTMAGGRHEADHLDVHRADGVVRVGHRLTVPPGWGMFGPAAARGALVALNLQVPDSPRSEV